MKTWLRSIVDGNVFRRFEAVNVVENNINLALEVHERDRLFLVKTNTETEQKQK